ncbi:hypothetical protein B0H63DRAFT_515143 [Podospora didyma]|uniref:Myb-like domain-containing protein n=1 Tax=Podospora didyma TaxID=330526 RepID=A0AAE0K234_9PEZI|nr:hypothetical protein B0H63DRAFT_515143 [Podospora didyma]
MPLREGWRELRPKPDPDLESVPAPRGEPEQQQNHQILAALSDNSLGFSGSQLGTGLPGSEGTMLTTNNLPIPSSMSSHPHVSPQPLGFNILPATSGLTEQAYWSLVPQQPFHLLSFASAQQQQGMNQALVLGWNNTNDASYQGRHATIPPPMLPAHFGSQAAATTPATTPPPPPPPPPTTTTTTSDSLARPSFVSAAMPTGLNMDYGGGHHFSSDASTSFGSTSFQSADSDMMDVGSMDVDSMMFDDEPGDPTSWRRVSSTMMHNPSHGMLPSAPVLASQQLMADAWHPRHADQAVDSPTVSPKLLRIVPSPSLASTVSSDSMRTSFVAGGTDGETESVPVQLAPSEPPKTKRGSVSVSSAPAAASKSRKQLPNRAPRQHRLGMLSLFKRSSESVAKSKTTIAEADKPRRLSNRHQKEWQRSGDSSSNDKNKKSNKRPKAPALPPLRATTPPLPRPLAAGPPPILLSPSAPLSPSNEAEKRPWIDTAAENIANMMADDAAAEEERLAKDEFLVRNKRAGMTYKEIRRAGGFTEAESTLRGRYRTLTKKRDERVRKPEWTEKDVQLLEAGVYKLTNGNPSKATTIPWKKVAQYIQDNGGTYLFGNATCRKRWDEECKRAANIAHAGHVCPNNMINDINSIDRRRILPNTRLSYYDQPFPSQQQQEQQERMGITPVGSMTEMGYLHPYPANEGHGYY